MNKFKIVWVLIYSAFIIHYSFFPVQAQVSTASPYSRYGIGDLQFGGFTKALGMGGTSLAINSPFSINFSNPATYSSLSLTTFEYSVSGNFYEVRNSTGKGYLNNVSLGYFYMALPIKYKKIGMSFGLMPYSKVGYDITTLQTNSDGHQEQHKYQGNGGLNQVYIGTGWAPFKDFSVGANASFLFGTLQQSSRVELPAGYNYYNTNVSQSTVIHDFYFNFGLLKTFDSLALAKSDSLVMLEKENKKLKDSIDVVKKAIGLEIKNQTSENRTELAIALTSLHAKLLTNETVTKNLKTRKQRSDWSFNIGATVAPTTALRGSHSVLAKSYIIYLTQEVAKDTIINIHDKSGNLILPLSLGTGISFKKGSQWIIASDFSLQNWKDYSLFGEKDSLVNSWRVSGGLQWAPNERSKSYMNTVQYRLGFHYEQSFLQLHTTQLNDAGVSIGFGFPMRRIATTVNSSVEMGRRGTISNNLIELNYWKFTIAFTINDRWFIKSKFD